MPGAIFFSILVDEAGASDDRGVPASVQGWWRGTVRGKNGLFPSNYVELI